MNGAPTNAVLAAIDPAVIKAFLLEVRRVIDSQITPATGAGPLGGNPAPVDYLAPEPTPGIPTGGWITDQQLRDVSRRMTEAISTEKWVDGFLAFAQLAMMAGGV